MKRSNVPRKPRRLLLLLMVLSLTGGAGGCGSPPSVVPVMQVVEQTLLTEARTLAAAESARDRLYLEQARQQLEDGYRRDLASAEALSPRWVESATSVYVAAREALLRQELALAAQRQTRVDNLQLAAQAQGRAVALLQRQDNLLAQTLGLDLWRLDPVSPAQPGGNASPPRPAPAAGLTPPTFRDFASYLSPE